MKKNKIYIFPVYPDLWPDEFHDRAMIGKKKNNQNDNLLPTINHHRHCFIEDVSLRIFPPRLNNNNPLITLRNEDAVLSKLFNPEGYSYREKDLSRFFSSIFKELMCESKVGIEIYIDDEEGSSLIKFPAKSIRFSLTKGKYYQELPKNSEDLRNSNFYSNLPEKGRKTIYFNKDDFFVVRTPKIILKTFPKFVERSNLLAAGRMVDNFMEAQKSGISYNGIQEEQLFQFSIFSDISAGRFDRGDVITEYYYLYRSLKFSEFVATAREDFMKQMNEFLKIICKRLKLPDNEFVVNGQLDLLNIERLKKTYCGSKKMKYHLIQLWIRSLIRIKVC